MDDLRLVELLQSIQHGQHHAHRRLAVHLALVLGDVLLIGLPLQELHSDIGRVVLFEEFIYAHDVRVVAEPGHVPGFRQETDLAVLELIGPVPRIDDDLLLSRDTVHDPIGVKFLHRHHLVQGPVPGPVGDAEAAKAYGAAHHEAPTQHSPRVQVIRLLRLGPWYKATVRAYAEGLVKRLSADLTTNHFPLLLSLTLDDAFHHPWYFSKITVVLSCPRTP